MFTKASAGSVNQRMCSNRFSFGCSTDDTDSMVSAYWEDDDLVARIRAKDDTYIVEVHISVDFAISLIYVTMILA